MPDTKSLSVGISILTYNRCAKLQDLLKRLSVLKFAPLEILVVDNHSLDGTQDMVGQWAGVRYIRMPANVGAAARNVGLREANSDIVITIDDDIIGLDDQGIANVVELFVRDESLGALNFRVVDEHGKICNWVHHRLQEQWCDRQFLTYEITEGAVAFRKEALKRSGYYTEGFFLSHEGPDLALRILENHFNVVYAGSITVIHLFAREGRDPWRNYYYDTRNLIWLAIRNFPVNYALIYLAKGLSSMLLYSVRDGYLRYWFKGVFDGIAGTRRAMQSRVVLSRRTMRMIEDMDGYRPSAAYMLKMRLFDRNSANLK